MKTIELFRRISENSEATISGSKECLKRKQLLALAERIKNIIKNRRRLRNKYGIELTKLNWRLLDAEKQKSQLEKNIQNFKKHEENIHKAIRTRTKIKNLVRKRRLERLKKMGEYKNVYRKIYLKEIRQDEKRKNRILKSREKNPKRINRDIRKVKKKINKSKKRIESVEKCKEIVNNKINRIKEKRKTLVTKKLKTALQDIQKQLKSRNYNRTSAEIASFLKLKVHDAQHVPELSKDESFVISEDSEESTSMGSTVDLHGTPQSELSSLIQDLSLSNDPPDSEAPNLAQELSNDLIVAATSNEIVIERINGVKLVQRKKSSNGKRKKSKFSHLKVTSQKIPSNEISQASKQNNNKQMQRNMMAKVNKKTSLQRIETATLLLRDIENPAETYVGLTASHRNLKQDSSEVSHETTSSDVAKNNDFKTKFISKNRNILKVTKTSSSRKLNPNCSDDYSAITLNNTSENVKGAADDEETKENRTFSSNTDKKGSSDVSHGTSSFEMSDNSNKKTNQNLSQNNSNFSQGNSTTKNLMPRNMDPKVVKTASPQNLTKKISNGFRNVPSKIRENLKAASNEDKTRENPADNEVLKKEKYIEMKQATSVRNIKSKSSDVSHETPSKGNDENFNGGANEIITIEIHKDKKLVGKKRNPKVVTSKNVSMDSSDISNEVQIPELSPIRESPSTEQIALKNLRSLKIHQNIKAPKDNKIRYTRSLRVKRPDIAYKILESAIKKPFYDIQPFEARIGKKIIEQMHLRQARKEKSLRNLAMKLLINRRETTKSNLSESLKGTTNKIQPTLEANYDKKEIIRLFQKQSLLSLTQGSSVASSETPDSNILIPNKEETNYVETLATLSSTKLVQKKKICRYLKKKRKAKEPLEIGDKTDKETTTIKASKPYEEFAALLNSNNDESYGLIVGSKATSNDTVLTKNRNGSKLVQKKKRTKGARKKIKSKEPLAIGDRLDEYKEKKLRKFRQEKH